VLGDARRAERLLEHDIAALGAEGHPDGIGQDVDAVQHALTGVLGEFHFLSRHCFLLHGAGWLSGFLLHCDVLEHAENVAFLHDEKLFPVDLHFSAGPFAEQHAVAGLHDERLDLSLFVRRAWANGYDFALLRLLLGGIGDDDAALGSLVLLDPAYGDAVMQWTKLPLSLLQRFIWCG